VLKGNLLVATSHFQRVTAKLQQQLLPKMAQWPEEIAPTRSHPITCNELGAQAGLELALIYDIIQGG
jgi:hypothetical protein